MHMTKIGLAVAVLWVSGCDIDPDIDYRTDWNNPTDKSGNNYHIPTVVLDDTNFRTAGASVVAVAQSLNSVIASYAWTLDGVSQSLTTDSLATTGWATGSHTVTVQVTDANGLKSAPDTAAVWIGNSLPILKKVADTVLSAKQTLAITLSATDADGTIASYAWIASTLGAFTTTTGPITLANAGGGTKTVRWKATDNDGAVSLDTFTVGFVPAPTIGRATADSALVSWNSTSKTGTLSFSWSGSITGFTSEAVTWTLYVGNAAFNRTQAYTGTDSSWSKTGVDSGVSYSYRLVGKNRFGDSSVATGSVTTAYVPQPSAADGWNTSITYGRLTDSRDGQTYWTVKIGTQTWMAQNLNYAVDSSWCYDNSADSCAKYGRLYQWSAAMGLASTYNSRLWSGTLPHQGVCPSGWHVPSDAEWSTLVQYVGSATSGTKLKSTSGWSSNTGTDAYGFRVLPAGYRINGGTSSSVGNYAYFWSSSESDASSAWYRFYYRGYAYVARDDDDKADGFSVRCLQN
jgi:uncharacterized protein (TIGR02145 family)